MTGAPFYVDAGGSRMFVNPGPWGVAITIRTGAYLSAASSVGITLDPAQVSRVAAALILAAASASTYQESHDPPCACDGCIDERAASLTR